MVVPLVCLHCLRLKKIHYYGPNVEDPLSLFTPLSVEMMTMQPSALMVFHTVSWSHASGGSRILHIFIMWASTNCPHKGSWSPQRYVNIVHTHTNTHTLNVKTGNQLVSKDEKLKLHWNMSNKNLKLKFKRKGKYKIIKTDYYYTNDASVLSE